MFIAVRRDEDEMYDNSFSNGNILSTIMTICLIVLVKSKENYHTKVTVERMRENQFETGVYCLSLRLIPQKRK